MESAYVTAMARSMDDEERENERHAIAIKCPSCKTKNRIYIYDRTDVTQAHEITCYRCYDRLIVRYGRPRVKSLGAAACWNEERLVAWDKVMEALEK